MKKLILSLIIILLYPVYLYALPAFPGAEGFGSDTIGGRGGTVYKITNLNDAGSGSFRAACAASGARIIVFDVSGTIRLTTGDITVTNPYLTIAGQTSPGGIQIAGSCFRLQTHDVIVTHMRFRRGSDNCSAIGGNASIRCNNGYGDAVQVLNSYNVIFDHCSIAWGADETVDIGEYYGNTYNITFSWNIITQGVHNYSGTVPGVDQRHGLGFLVSSKYQGYSTLTVTGHHNYLSHFYYRLPQVGGSSVDWYNNVIYNWGTYSEQVDWRPSSWPKTYLNSRHNYRKAGPSHDYWNGCDSYGTWQIHNGHFMNYDNAAGNYELSGTPEKIIHTNGNIACALMTDTSGVFFEGYNIGQGQYISSDWIDSSPLAFVTYSPTITTMSLSYANSVLSTVGATKPSRDSLDTTVVADFTNNTGTWIVEGTSYPTGWPTYSSPDPPADTDSDGMSDAWEVTKFGDLTKTAIGTDLGGGYNNIEWYIHELGGYAEAADTTVPTLSTKVISTNGTTLTLTFSEAVSQGAGYNDSDIDVDCSGGGNDIAVTYVSGNTSNIHTYTIATPIMSGETCNIDFTWIIVNGDANSLEDAAGNDLAAITSGAVTNSSTRAYPTYSSGTIDTTGRVVTLTYNESVAAGVGGTGGYTLTCSGGAVTIPNVNVAGTTVVLRETSRVIESGETCTTAYTQPGNGIEDASGDDLQTYTGAAVTNNSTQGPPLPSTAGKTLGGGLSVGGGGKIQ